MSEPQARPGAETPYWLRALRLLRLILLVIEGLVTAALVLPRVDPARRDRLIRRWSQTMLRILNVRLDATGAVPGPDVRNALFVANHISWLDVFVLDSVRPVHFVAKHEVRSWPVLGWLAARAGTLFIRRANRRDTARINEEAAQVLRRGGCIAFFPEAATTDGSALLPFHTSLLQPAVDAQSAIFPIGIRYLDATGTPTPAAAFIDGVSFPQSILRILGLREIRARLHFGAPLSAAGRNRRELTHACEASIAHMLDLPTPHRHSAFHAG